MGPNTESLNMFIVLGEYFAFCWATLQPLGVRGALSGTCIFVSFQLPICSMTATAAATIWLLAVALAVSVVLAVSVSVT